MIQYELRAFCPYCSAFHDAVVRIPMVEAFSIRSVAHVYSDSELPQEIRMVLSQQFRCTKFGASFTPRNLERMFLVMPGAVND